MELVKNIFFNTDKLVEMSTVKVSYAGYLFQKGVNEVYFHYGFGSNWNDAAEVKMVKTELGFQCEIDIPETDTLSFCFRDVSGEWDNNFGQNFSFPVEKIEVETEEDNITNEELSLITTSETGMEVRKGLRKSYILSKKIKLAIYKIIHYVPKLISGNYKRKVEE